MANFAIKEQLEEIEFKHQEKSAKLEEDAVKIIGSRRISASQGSLGKKKKVL